MKSTHLVRTLHLIEALRLTIPAKTVLRLLDQENDVTTIIAG